jgi:hypothetical protein
MLQTSLVSRLARDVVLLDELFLDVGQFVLRKNGERLPRDAERILERPVLVVSLVEELLLELVAEPQVLEIGTRESGLAYDLCKRP